MNTKNILAGIAAFALCACSSPKANKVEEADVIGSCETIMLVGSYAPADSMGIKSYRFDEVTGEAAPTGGLKGISNPSYLTVNADGSMIYAVGEDSGVSSTANAVKFNKADGSMTLLNSQPTEGGAPCYISLDPTGQFVLTANYGGGSISVFGINSDGSLLPAPQVIGFWGKGKVKGRQDKPHLHCVEFTPDGRFLLANDLGTDKIYTFPVSQVTDPQTASSLLGSKAKYGYNSVKLTPGSGPRHICFHPNGKWGYLINEISGMVTKLDYDGNTLTPSQYIAADTVDAQGSGDIHIASNGKFLFASNRLNADGVVTFAVNPQDGSLTRVSYQLTGAHPRNFAISPNGKFMLVACRDTNEIEVYEINPDNGKLTDTRKRVAMTKPVCIKFVKQ